MSLIEFSNINLKYEDKTIFKDFNLSIEEGEKVIILGKSGNGKSSLIKMLLGFQSFDSGSIIYNNKIVLDSDFRNLRNNFAYVNQDVTLRQGNVRGVLKEISEFSNNTYNGDFDDKLADYFDFSVSLLDKNVEELSGGERQRLGIIIAIMLDRPIFLLDEVTSSLDRALKEKTVSYFAESHKTVISISHDSQWSENSKFRKVEW